MISWTLTGSFEQEDRAQREGLATDIRQPDLPPTTESDGIYRGTFEVDGTAQEGVRVDEKYALEEGAFLTALHLGYSCLAISLLQTTRIHNRTRSTRPMSGNQSRTSNMLTTTMVSRMYLAVR